MPAALLRACRANTSARRSHCQDGAVAVRHVTVLEHAFEVEHLEPATSVKGLEGLALHLIRRRHGFDGRARHPLPLALAADPAPRIRAMGLSVPAPDAAALASFGLGLTAAGRAGRAAAERPKYRVHAGVDKFTSFFLFNANIVSRLSAYFATRPLAYARGVGVNMALGATMQVPCSHLRRCAVVPARHCAVSVSTSVAEL